MTASLTLQQIALLRRLDDGLGLPAYVLRPRNCSQDVELLCLLELLASAHGTLAVTAMGRDYLREVASLGKEDPVSAFRVSHARDQSITVEHWPQEY